MRLLNMSTRIQALGKNVTMPTSVPKTNPAKTPIALSVKEPTNAPTTPTSTSPL